MSKAFIFDLNGTMINDMQYHITAWHRILNGLGANLTPEQMKLECYGKNNEILERIFPGRFSTEEKEKMSMEKEKQYQHEFRPYLKLLSGLEDFLKDAKRRDIKMAIGSAAIMFNIDFVLDGLHIRHYFDTIVSADEVSISKPDPETFLKSAGLLNIPPKDCIVFEDSPKGVEAAERAGMKTVVLTTMHEENEFSLYKNIVLFTPDFNAVSVPYLAASSH
jgi:beta-phosphoglucomutase